MLLFFQAAEIYWIICCVVNKRHSNSWINQAANKNAAKLDKFVYMNASTNRYQFGRFFFYNTYDNFWLDNAQVIKQNTKGTMTDLVLLDQRVTLFIENMLVRKKRQQCL